MACRARLVRGSNDMPGSRGQWVSPVAHDIFRAILALAPKVAQMSSYWPVRLMNVKADPGPRTDSVLPLTITKRGKSGATPGSKTHSARPRPIWVSELSLLTVAMMGPEMLRSITFSVTVFMSRTFRAPVVWMVVTPLFLVKVVSTSLLVVISRRTGKPQGLFPCVSVNINGCVGSGFGCLVGRIRHDTCGSAEHDY